MQARPAWPGLDQAQAGLNGMYQAQARPRPEKIYQARPGQAFSGEITRHLWYDLCRP